MALSCCKRQEMRLLDVEVEDVTIGETVRTRLAVEVVNPSYAVKILQADGVLRRDTAAIVLFSAEPFEIPARDSSRVSIEVSFRPAPGVGRFALLRLLSRYEDCVADVDFTVRGPLGITRKKHLEGISLRSLTRQGNTDKGQLRSEAQRNRSNANAVVPTDRKL